MSSRNYLFIGTYSLYHTLPSSQSYKIYKSLRIAGDMRAYFFFTLQPFGFVSDGIELGSRDKKIGVISRQGL